MKNLIILFFSITLLNLVFVGCQTNDDLTSPVLDKKPLVTGPEPVNGYEDPGILTEVDLIAGGTTVCGHITVMQVGTTRELELYYYADPGWVILETHAGAGAFPSYLPIDETTGYPDIGYFEDNVSYRDVGGVTVAGPIYLTIPLTQAWERMVYVGAHAIVKNCQGTVVTANICPDDLAQNATLLSLALETDYYVKLTFDQPVIDEQTEFYGWCVDNERGISAGTLDMPVNFLCSYTTDINTCIVDKPENLGKANWIINYKEENGWSMANVQAALWSLLSDGTAWVTAWTYDQSELDAILLAAADKGDWEPTECDQKVLVLLYQAGESADLCDDIEKQVLAIEVPVQCEEIPCTEDIIAWAFNLPLDGTSEVYNDRYWYRFFGYWAY